MPDFKPLSLLQTRSYPGYQFYATMKYRGQSSDRCMKYIILTVLNWLRQKIGGEAMPEELQLPSPKRFTKVSNDAIRSYHFSGGFTLDITSLLDHGIWAARIKEPDLERQDKKAIIGRFFVTEIGLHRLEDSVECGVRIDVLDPIDVTEEVPNAYRPAFMRHLFATKQLRIRQIEPLKYSEAHTVNNPMAMKRLIELISNEQNYMPIIVLTYASEQRSIMEVVEKLDKGLGLTNTSDSFMNRLKQLDLIPETLEFGDAILPYDADYMAYHTFGYGRVYVIAGKQFATFRKKINKPSLQPGDLLWIEPIRFGGNCQIVSYDPNMAAGVREYRRNKIVEDAHRYSKHKIVSFGSVVFESAARRLEIEDRIKSRLEELRSGDEEKAEQRTEEIYRETQELLSLYEDEKKETDAECERLRNELQGLYGKMAILEGMAGRKVGQEDSIPIRVPEVEEYYIDEQHDLIISILQEAKRSYCTPGTRADELLDGILAVNELTGEGKELFDRLKTILFRNKNITDSDISDLRALGFEVSRRSNNHFKLVFRGDSKYTFTLSSTGSDGRGMKNSYSDISNHISVYK